MCIHKALKKVLKKDNIWIFNEIINSEIMQVDECYCGNDRSLNSFIIAKMIKYEALNIFVSIIKDAKFTIRNEFNADILFDMLKISIIKKRIDVIELFIKNGMDINKIYKYDETPLFCAVRYFCKEIIEFLLKNGADINKISSYGWTPLHLAVNNDCVGSYDRYSNYKDSDCIDIAELLLCHGANVDNVSNSGETPLYHAIRYVHKEKAELLLRYGADVNKTNDYGETPLHRAVNNNNKEIVELLLRYGADTNKADNTGRTPLCIAVRSSPFNNRKEIVELLIKHGADVNKADNEGKTPLYLAVTRRHNEIVEFLIAHGADVNKADTNNITPMHRAIDNKNMEIVELLIKHGADVNKVNNEGETLLHYALYGGRKKFAKILVKNGADINKVNANNITPYEVVKKYKNKNLLIFFEKYNRSNSANLIMNSKTVLQNKQLIAMAHVYDERSLFSGDYLCRDLLKLILFEINNQYLRSKCEILIKDSRN